MATDLLDPTIEDHEVVDYLQQPLLRAELRQRSIERLLDLSILLPSEPVLLRRVDHRVAQPLNVVAGHHELDGGEELADELRPLIADRLPDPLRDGDLRSLQLDRADRD